MLRWTCFILLSSWFLYDIPATPPPNISLSKKKSSEIFKDRQGVRIAEGLVLGQKSMNSGELKVYRELGLLHLFTPSGLHLSSLIKLIPKSWLQVHWLSRIFFLIILLLIYLFPLEHFALRRMALWSFLRQGKHFWISWPGMTTTFLLCFLIDYLWGTWTHSPLSFCYSFIFAGAFLLLGDHARLVWPFGLILCYGILGQYFGQYVSLLTIFASLFLTFLFTPVFLVASFVLLLHYLFSMSHMFAPLEWIHALLKPLAAAHKSWPGFSTDLATSFVCLCLMQLHPWRLPSASKKIFYGVVLLLIPATTLNVPLQAMKPLNPLREFKLSRGHVSVINSHTKKPEIRLESGQICHMTFRQQGMFLSFCRVRRAQNNVKSTPRLTFGPKREYKPLSL